MAASRRTATAGDEPGDAHERRRSAAINRILSDYRAYARSGRSRLWSGAAKGTKLAAAERDGWLVRTLRGDPPRTIVDLGCGDGNVALLLDGAGLRPRRYIGIDIVEERLDQARRRVPWGEFLHASADRVPIPTDIADAVVAMTLFSSIREDWFRKSIADEIARILRPGGRLLIYDLRYRSPRNPNVVRFGPRELDRFFPGWPGSRETITLLPPLARLPIGAGARRYRVLSSIPALRSHLATVLTRP